MARISSELLDRVCKFSLPHEIDQAGGDDKNDRTGRWFAEVRPADDAADLNDSGAEHWKRAGYERDDLSRPRSVLAATVLTKHD